jgi:hypothetical protein
MEVLAVRDAELKESITRQAAEREHDVAIPDNEQMVFAKARSPLLIEDVSPTRGSACRNHLQRSNDDPQHDPDHAGTRGS